MTAGVLTFLVVKMILHWPCYTVNIARPLTKRLRKAEAEYWCGAFKEVKNTTEFWSLVKRVKNTNVDSNIGKLQVDEEFITDTSLKAESLNEIFL